MKFKNVSNKVKFLKVDKWLSVKPGEIVELPDVTNEKDLKQIVDGKKVKAEEPVDDEDLNEEPVDENKFKTKDELKKMSKDEINDYAANIGFATEITTGSKKSKMIKEILKLQSK